MSDGVLEVFQRRCGRQKAAEYDCTRHFNAFAVQTELGENVLAQGNERDAAKVGQRGVLEHNFGELLGPVSSDAVGADAAIHRGAHESVSGC